MKTNLVDNVDFCFTSSVIAQLSTLVDETEPGIERALHQAVPLVLNGLASRVGQGLTPDGLLALMHDADDANVLEQLTTPAVPQSYECGTNLLLDLLGERYRSTVNQLAVDASIRPTASGTLLQVAATAVLGVLGRLAVANAFSATDFVYWLHAQKVAIGAAMLPLPAIRQPVGVAPHVVPPAAGLSPAVAHTRSYARSGLLLLGPALGLGFLLGHSATRPTLTTRPKTANAAADSATHAAMLALVTAIAAADAAPAETPAAFFESPVAPAPAATSPATPAPVTKTAGKTGAKTGTKTGVAPAAATVAATASPKAVPVAAARPAAEAAPVMERRPAAPIRSELPAGRFDSARDVYVYNSGRPVEVTLAPGSTQQVGANSTENRLYRFLSTPTTRVDSVNRTRDWIVFDQVYFEPGKATLTAESVTQLRNTARILQAFPNAVVKIGGYTDSTGVAEPNYQLSGARARAVMMALTNFGVRLYRLHAQGFGEKFFLAPNSTPAARALNRRVSIRVLRK